MNVDPLSEMYQAYSPYIYVLNRPTVAKDPDGKLVVFINGNHYGSGEKPSYWRVYGKRRVTDRKASQWLDPGEYHYEYYEVRAFDTEVMDQLNDHNPLYRDGGLVGGAPFNFNAHLNPWVRYSKGYDRGSEDAAQIIEMIKDENGNIVETIKVITHSMGGIYGKGYVRALKDYIKAKGLEKEALIELVVDFDPFQAGHYWSNADLNTYTMQFSNTTEGKRMHLTGRLANQMQKGVDFPFVNTGPGSTSSHSIFEFFNNISQLSPGIYIWDAEKEEWICQSCN